MKEEDHNSRKVTDEIWEDLAEAKELARKEDHFRFGAGGMILLF